MAPKPRAGGRPRVAPTEKRTSVVTVRFTRDERTRIARQASVEGLSVGVWVRHQALLALGAT
jgi:uncharacterized protein (DUF2384 family)